MHRGLSRGLLLLTGVFLVALQATPRGQPPDASHASPTAPAFEVASIKPATATDVLLTPSAPDRFFRHNMPLAQLLAYAYEVNAFQIDGGDSWTRISRFDIEARADGRQTPEQMRLMVRRLLAERFNLQLHMETRDLPRYALVKSRRDGRLGDNLRPSAIDCPAITSAPDYRPPTGPPQPGDPPRCGISFRISGAVRTLTLQGAPISELARALEPDAGRVIIDKTGLPGTYDIELETAMPALARLPSIAGQPVRRRDGLSLFIALQGQLGLTLESDRGPVDILVIDYVERPSPN